MSDDDQTLTLTDDQALAVCQLARKLGAGVAVHAVNDEADDELAGFRAALERCLAHESPTRPESAFARLLLDGAERGETATRAQLN